MLVESRLWVVIKVVHDGLKKPGASVGPQGHNEPFIKA